MKKEIKNEKQELSFFEEIRQSIRESGGKQKDEILNLKNEAKKCKDKILLNTN